ncbi:nuclear transport factor 2 family protein [Paractinoplanes hotanensis]|uniref:Nuclear transport factor 2 family protein n=1 Tax=Paractinoplanes hotanensis TaxID=2906497 RepID=A0ABT0Y057_9ACTN|nr:nuclear transport factor 2 family protein [Actinoplanes hotanensis]MCM4079250.1 nuclear transport factor 2 family protein [Actinoplanes hotanensis]
MRTCTFVSGLTAAAAVAAFIAGAAAPSTAAPRTETPQAGTQQVVGHAQQSSRTDQAPAIVRRWAAAWRTTDTRDLARLYTKDAVYTDRALNLVFRGREGVTEWETGSHQLVGDLGFEVTGGFRGRDEAVVEGVFSGHIVGAPRPFAVPAVTVLRLRGDLIRASDDYYNRGEILSDSGLPADWTPPGS